MTIDWHNFLHDQGANLDAGLAADFGDPAAELAAARDGLVLADLSHWGLIGCSGEDAQGFLHGQITNDLRDLSPERAVFAAYCTAKGRMLANFLIFKRDDELLVMLPEAVREAIQKRLTMFVLRAKVRLRDAGAEWLRLGLSGPGAETLLAEATGLAPAAEILSMAHTDNVFAVRLGGERFDLFATPDAAPKLWQKLADRARPVGARAWDWLMVAGGVPAVLPETQERFVPQMANLVELNGISFNKGCYPGQEIVARSQYLGKQKRRMYLAHVEADTQAGAPLFSPEDETQAAGWVANAAPAPEGGSDLLAVLQIAAYEGGEVHLDAPDGPRLAFRPLPYPFAESGS